MIFKNAKPMGCGGCGNGLFRMYNLRPTDTLLAECTKCGSVSSITASRPTVDIGWTEGSSGLLTVSEPTGYQA